MRSQKSYFQDSTLPTRSDPNKAHHHCRQSSCLHHPQVPDGLAVRGIKTFKTVRLVNYSAGELPKLLSLTTVLHLLSSVRARCNKTKSNRLHSICWISFGWRLSCIPHSTEDGGATTVFMPQTIYTEIKRLQHIQKTILHHCHSEL